MPSFWPTIARLRFARLRAVVPVLLITSGAAGCTGEVEDTSTEPPVKVAGHQQGFRTGWWGADHDDITQSGLRFLRSDVRQRLGDENEALDEGGCEYQIFNDCPYTKYRSEYHCDNCRISECLQSMEWRYDRLVEALNPASPDIDTAYWRFGSILHTAQDFYAHTNWVDSATPELFSTYDLHVPEVFAGSQLGPFAVATNLLPSGFTITAGSNARIPMVSNGASSRWGLISGVYEDNLDAPICPASFSIPHGDFNVDGAFKNAPYRSYLAKDDPDAFNYNRAIEHAEDQTSMEFCRLVRRVTLRYGNEGREFLLSGWVSDRAAYNATCPADASIVAGAIATALF